MIDIIQKVENRLSISINYKKYLLIGNAFDKKTLFLYKNGVKRPYLVVRIPNSLEAEQRCKNEYNNLLYINNTNISNVIASKPLGVISYGGYKCYLQQTLFSKQMQKSLRTILKIPRKSDFNVVVRHLSTIYKETKDKNTLKDKTYSYCFQHGDFWIGNLGFINKSLVLYDLEFANKEGYPLYDLLHFALHYHVVLNNIGKLGKNIRDGSHTKKVDNRVFESIEKSFITHLNEGGRFTRLLKNAINSYTTLCKIEEKDTKLLIKNYFEKYRKIKDFNNNWENEVFKKIL